MHPSVRSYFRTFTEPLEGVVPYMYQDVLGLVTIGIGNLIDPVSLATPLPFRFKAGAAGAGRAASKAEITAEWTKIKNNKSLAKAGYRACAGLTALELSGDAITNLVNTKLDWNEKDLKHRFHEFQNYEDWPADAQLGLLSMAWAMGTGAFRHFPHFRASCGKRDFDGAAAQSHMQGQGISRRNTANKHLFENAARVLEGTSNGYNPANLYYPVILSKTGVPSGS